MIERRQAVLKRPALETILSTMAVGICVGGLASVAIIFDEQTILENSRAFWFAIFG